MTKYKATGTEDVVAVTERKSYTREQHEAMKYAEKMNVSLAGMTVKKMLAIREQIRDI